MRVQYYQKSDHNTTFGSKYTKNSIKFLKDNIPKFTENKEFELAQKALNNLLQAKNRGDNLLVNIHDGDVNFLSYSVRHASGNSKKFHYPVLTPTRNKENTDAEDFLAMAEFINSDKFVQESNRVITQYFTRKAKLPFFKKLKENILEYTKINKWSYDLLDNLITSFSPKGCLIIKKDGTAKQSKGIFYLLDVLSENFSKTKSKPQNNEKFSIEKQFKQDTLLNLINQLEK